MDSEKMAVLKMLEARQITAVQAERLLSEGRSTSRSEKTGSQQVPTALKEEGGVLKRLEKLFEQKVTSQGAEFLVSGKNGSVLIKGYNGDKISVSISYTPKRPVSEDALKITVLGNKYFLSYNENDFEEVDIDAFIPENMFARVKIEAANGGVGVSNITANDICVESTGGGTRLTEITAKNVTVECYNAALSASNIDAQTLKMAVINGGIDMDGTRFEKYNNYSWLLECSNGGLNILLPPSNEAAYHVCARATLSTVKLNLAGMTCITHDKHYHEAKSRNFRSSAKTVALNLETSNAPIIVN